MSIILLKIAATIDSISEWTGRLVSWLIVLMALVVGYDVAMRYLFQSGSVALQELEWHIFALIFLLGAAYTLKHDDHVRVDLCYRSRWMTRKRRAWVDFLGAVLFLLPFCLLIINGSLPFVVNAWSMSEISPDPGGLPARWLLKAAIPFGFALLFLQGIALIIRNGLMLCNVDLDEDVEKLPDTHVETLRHNEQDHLL